jgi:hypothetical protein
MIFKLDKNEAKQVLSMAETRAGQGFFEVLRGQVEKLDKVISVEGRKANQDEKKILGCVREREILKQIIELPSEAAELLKEE